ncbi:MAG TPA: sulfatase, partial [Blastocatellia bacterium]|nr:sulfatase [Blastocatellia bacterium]
TFAIYFSLNLIVGAIIGLMIGILARITSFLTRAVERALARGGEVKTVHKLIAGLFISAIVAVTVNLQPQAHSYITGLIIEAQKLPYLYGRLLKYDTLLSFLIVTGLFISCWLVWRVSRAAGQMTPLMRNAWMLFLIAVIAIAYYIDSRIEVQLYEYTLHRSMFLLCMAAALGLAASVYSSSSRVRQVFASKSFSRVAVTVAVLLAGAAVFTFYRFGNNQNLKSQLLSRTTQAKQHFRLIHWVMDFDRDGYSPYLSGGDADDTRADINPEQTEIVGDGIDNNQIGGDLSQEAMAQWHNSRRMLHAPTPPASQRFNIVYIFLDACRADHMSAYGYERNTTPNFDKLAARSALFENAFSPSSNTFESAARFMKSSYWDASVETWTEALARNGYQITLFPEKRLPMLRRYVKGMQVAPGSQGKEIKETIDVAIETLGKAPADRPFCTYIYAVEPHRPYAPHEEFTFGSSVTDRYDGEIAYTDFHFGRLFDWLEQNGRMKDTMIVVMADHAESLGERGVYRHSSELFNDQTHIPMIFYVPGQSARRVTDYVSSVDLGTTILNTVGIQCPEQYAGVSLLALMRGEAFTHPPIFGEQTLREKEFPNLRSDQYPQPINKKYMIITQDGFKLMYNRNMSTFQLFDLKSDPKEQHNLYDQMSHLAVTLQNQLGEFIDIVTASRPANADEAKYLFGEEDDSD